MLRHPMSRIGATAFVGLAFMVCPVTALGHAAFLQSNPAPGTRLQSGPAQISLDFTEPINRGLSNASLIDIDTGDPVSATVSSGRDRQLVLQPRTRLAKGAYRVDWHTVSTLDGHALEGGFGFGVRVRTGIGEQSVEQSPLARNGWLRITVRAGFYVALFFFAGGLFGTALLSRGRARANWLVPSEVAAALEGTAGERGEVRSRVWRRTLDAGWLAVAGAVAVVLVEASDAGGGLSPAALGDFLFTNIAGLARAGVVVAIALAVVHANRVPIAASAWLAIAFLAVAISGHANSADPRGLSVFTDWLHMVAAAAWIGGIAQLALTWLPRIKRIEPAARQSVMSNVLKRFGRLALPAFLVVVTSGLANALTQLGEPQALWQTAYGRILAVKMALVGLIALASYGHALRLRPRMLAANPHPSPGQERRHWRLLGIEPWLGLGVLVAVAVLVTFPLPPRQLNEADEAQAATPCEPFCPLPGARADELPAANHAGPNIVGFWLRREGNRLTGTIRVLDVRQKPVDAEVALNGESEGCGRGCRRIAAPAGPEELRVNVSDDNGEHPVRVPASWRADRSKQARVLLARAQRTMRALDTVRMKESIGSGLGQTVRTRYRFQAPGRMAYRTSSGTRFVALGNRAFASIEGGPFEHRRFGADGFQFARQFRWTVYGRSVRWLDANRRVIRLALFDQATPVWFRLTIDRRSERVLREDMIAAGHFMSRRYFAFNRPVSIRPPR
jgi:copper transport protein